jgi:hypothetical protein
MFRLSYSLLGAAFLLFFIYKVLRFDALGYSFNDMYAFVQMSCSWMDGRPFMYDNIWSYHHRIHNYYTVLLWGPACYYFGAKGLFAIQSGLLLLACWLVNRYLIQVAVPVWVRVAMLGVVILGPVSLWLNDHPNIGWHTELTYLPAALLWAISTAKPRFAVLIAGLFLALIKEDGAVLALLIHASAFSLSFISRADSQQTIGQLLTKLLGQRPLWGIVIFWSVVFVVGMVWLAAKNDFAEPRLRNALQLMAIHADDRAFLKPIFWQLCYSLLLLLPVAGLLYWLTASMLVARRVTISLIWLVGITMLTVLNLVQSAHYLENPLYYLVSLTWPPRYVLLWAFSAAFLVLLTGNQANELRPKAGVLTWIGLASLWLIQGPLLQIARPDLPGWAEWKAALVGPPGVNMHREFLDPADLQTIRYLADRLPPRSNVFAFDYVTPFFHRHYGIWPTGNHWQTADVAVMARPDIQRIGPWLDKLLPQPRDSVRLKHYTIYYRPAFATFVRQSTQLRNRP